MTLVTLSDVSGQEIRKTKQGDWANELAPLMNTQIRIQRNNGMEECSNRMYKKRSRVVVITCNCNSELK